MTPNARFDAHCITGYSHLRQGRHGQDRAFAGAIADHTILAIVSDGCGSASGNSEIGAEAMIRSCRSALAASTTYRFDADFKRRLCTSFAAEVAGSSIDDYFATMVAVLVSPHSIEFFVVGDGAWLLRHSDGTLTLTQISWWRNRPFYLAYRADASLEAIQTSLESETKAPVCEVRTHIALEGERPRIIDHEERWHACSSFIDGKRIVVPDCTTITAAAVITDGLADVEGIPAREVAAQLFAHINEDGPFMQRQMISTLSRLAAQGHFAFDDLSVAAVAWSPARQ